MGASYGHSPLHVPRPYDEMVGILIASHQFSVGGVTSSTTQYLTGPLILVSRSPNCSCNMDSSSPIPSGPSLPPAAIRSFPEQSTAN